MIKFFAEFKILPLEFRRACLVVFILLNQNIHIFFDLIDFSTSNFELMILFLVLLQPIFNGWLTDFPFSGWAELIAG